MENTQIGTEGKKQNQPDDVERQAIDAPLASNDHIYAATSAKTKLEGMIANAAPGGVKAVMHENGQAAGRKEGQLALEQEKPPESGGLSSGGDAYLLLVNSGSRCTFLAA